MEIFKILLILFIFYILNSGYQKYKKIHPKQLNGPIPIPILGNLHQLEKYGLPHHTLTEFHKTYGPIYRVFFGDVYTVIVSDPKLIKEICIDHHYSIGKNRPITPTFKYAQNDTGISLTNGNWERNRKIVSNSLKKMELIFKKTYDLLDYQVEELIKSMRSFEETNQPFEIKLYAHRYTLATMFKFIFNEDVPYDQDINKSLIGELSGPLNEIFKDLSSGKLGDFINILSPLYYWYLCYTEKNIKKLKNFIKNRLFEHASTINLEEQPRDFLDILIKEYGKENIESIIGVIMDIFLAGSDTTAASIEWFVLRMCNNQNIQEKLYNEIKSATGGRNIVKLSDRPSTPYLNATIKEVLRINTVGPFGLPKYCIEDTIVGDHFIPKNSQVLINYRGLGYNESNFENPNQFIPERYLGKTNNDSYFPFSTGERDCVGKGLANDEIYLAFSNIILNFNLSSIDNKLIDDTENFGLTLKPNNFKINLKKR